MKKVHTTNEELVKAIDSYDFHEGREEGTLRIAFCCDFNTDSDFGFSLTLTCTTMINFKDVRKWVYMKPIIEMPCNNDSEKELFKTEVKKVTEYVRKNSRLGKYVVENLIP